MTTTKNERNPLSLATVTAIAFVTAFLLAWTASAHAEEILKRGANKPMALAAKTIAARELLMMNELRAEADLRAAEKTGEAMSLAGYEYEAISWCNTALSAAYYNYNDEYGDPQWNGKSVTVTQCCLSTEDADGKNPTECKAGLDEDYYESSTGFSSYKNTNLAGRISVSRNLVMITPEDGPAASWAYLADASNLKHNDRKSDVTEGGEYEKIIYRSQFNLATSTFVLDLPNANSWINTISWQRLVYATNLPPQQ